MKYIKSYILFALTVFAFTACTMDDLQDDVNDLKDRVTLIEQEVKLLNENLKVVSYILDPQNKTISNVETVKEDGVVTQYVITLSNDSKLTLTIGAPGAVNKPEITVGEDGNWYVNGVSSGITAVGKDGANGEGFPEFRVEKGNWQVRFGTGAWENVPGGEGITNGSLGDQLFESAKVDGSNFVVTLKDGTIHKLPIVASLVCKIDKSGLTLDADGFWVIEKGERAEVLVNIVGENPQVTYPQGWRATLNKLEVADANGNNYKLYIYAPAAQAKSLTRAAADNTADVAIMVQKGTFWAVDKIRVKIPKDYSNNLVKYDDNLAVAVGGLDIKKDVYGEATEITADASITEGGVYFVSTDNVTLTYDLPTTGVDDLIIIPTTADVKTINLTVSRQIYFKGTFACQNVILNQSQALSNYPLRVSATDAQVAFDKCSFPNLVVGKGIIMPNTSADPERLNYFGITDSDIKFDKAGANTYLVNGMDCSELVLNNNIVYYSKDVPEDTNAFGGTGGTNGHFTQFKVYGANTKTVSKLEMKNNTFIDVEANGTGGLLGLVWALNVTEFEISNNLYWLSFPATLFKSGAALQTKTVLVRLTANPAPSPVGRGVFNYIYSGNSAVKDFGVYTSVIPGVSEIISNEIFFDTTNPLTFNKTTGVFIPKADYTQYGAQR